MLILKQTHHWSHWLNHLFQNETEQAERSPSPLLISALISTLEKCKEWKLHQDEFLLWGSCTSRSWGQDAEICIYGLCNTRIGKNQTKRDLPLVLEMLRDELKENLQEVCARTLTRKRDRQNEKLGVLWLISFGREKLNEEGQKIEIRQDTSFNNFQNKYALCVGDRTL